MTEISTLVTLPIILLTLIYFFLKKKFSYWKERNVYHQEPSFYFGNIGSVLKREKHMNEIISDVYNEAKAKGEKYCGLYALWSPQFVPIDLELIKCIIQKDFAHFTNHGFYINEEKDPLSGHLFNLENEKWKNLRAKLTPTFTSGKMKMMFQTMIDCTTDLQDILKASANTKDPVDIKDILSCLTTDVIGSVAFGIEINSMKNPDSDFRKFGKKTFHVSFRESIIFALLNMIPRWLAKGLGLKLFKEDMESFYINLVKNTVDYRETNNIYRKDFMHLLIQLKNTGKITEDEVGVDALKKKDNIQGITINEMAAQCFVFFVAGFETSATTVTFALLELSQNKVIQDKTREEINKVLKKYDNKITYEAIMEMEYMEKVISETLRKHPPVGVIPRVCNKDYKVENSDLLIKAETRINIPVMSIHRDPDYYPDPDKFDPERFNEKNKDTRPSFCYLPFGEGPRTCIGLRFGKLQTKVALCSVLQNYKVTLNEKTELPIKYETSFITFVKNGVWLNLEPIETN